MVPQYIYRATCSRVVDGDTFIADIDLGFRVHISLSIRLKDVDAPERKEHPAGDDATAYLNFLIMDVPLIIVSDHDHRSFERWVADVWLADSLSAKTVQATMVEAGHARYV